MTTEEFQSLVRDANARLAAMTPEQQRAHWNRQLESWVRGMTTPCEHGVLDFEQCPRCRNG